ncbi:phospholipase D family protein [Roseomonas xinghualingensis]|uniref:phospholipase D family protein n=1 Tax=Roseomonas xinghualingensis TaxID=2986475 RepID=UPI0021F1CC9F|nr:phospholipase D-like domain-containing protein [Roseomonas sp. SXEYE001]MCV4205978.1 phospholipase D-like domain-containing protein [Roseomonas sp. SXEYE001]
MPDKKNDLSTHYRKAFSEASELFVVVAYLTEWDKTLPQLPARSKFRLIVGKDFGITRKNACQDVLDWLPAKRSYQFMVADHIEGFHPKAAVWKTHDNRHFAIVGSSNLTRAAFSSNFEANVYTEISAEIYQEARNWLNEIEKKAVIVSEDWLKKYREAPRSSNGKRPAKSNTDGTKPVINIKLPLPKGTMKIIQTRRDQLEIHKKYKKKLVHHFRRCADGEITSKEFYSQLPDYWGYNIGNRLQGPGFERQGRSSDFSSLSRAFIRVLNTSPCDRDDVVIEEIDRLADEKVSSRKAFFTEMLCLSYPEEYPILNSPVQKYLEKIEFRAPRGASEGVKYVDLAKKLRLALLSTKNFPAKNIAELDAVIWHN